MGTRAREPWPSPAPALCTWAPHEGPGAHHLPARACGPAGLPSRFPHSLQGPHFGVEGVLLDPGCGHGGHVGWARRCSRRTLRPQGCWGGTSLPADGPTSRWRVLLGGALLSRNPSSGGQLGVPDAQCFLLPLPGRLRAEGRGVLLLPKPAVSAPGIPARPGAQELGSLVLSVGRLLPPEHLPGSRWGPWGGACSCSPQQLPGPSGWSRRPGGHS